MRTGAAALDKPLSLPFVQTTMPGLDLSHLLVCPCPGEEEDEEEEVAPLPHLIIPMTNDRNLQAL